MWVRKLNPAATAFLYSATIGGSGSSAGTFETAGGIAVDAEGNAYVTGTTASPDFPTTPGAFQQSGPGSLGTTGVGAFVTKLGPTGTPVYATLLAGDRGEEAFGIAVDLAGHAYVTGYTLSSNFPTTPGAFQTAKKGSYDAFVTKLTPDGSGLVYSTHLGGQFQAPSASPATTFARGIAVDPTGNAHIAGLTDSGDFPTTPDAFQRAIAGGGFDADAFLTKLNVTGSALLYSTYFGGAGEEQALALAVDSIGDAYLTGVTTSAFDLPKAPGFTPFQQLNAGARDAFLAKFSTGTPGVLSISTILPNAGGDTGSVTTIVHGTGFAAGATVKLVRSGEADIAGDPVAVAADGRTVSATFDLTGKARGNWDVVVTNPDSASATMPEGFIVQPGRAPQLWVDIVARDTILARRPQTLYITYGNRGNVDAVGVPIWISGIPTDATLTLGFLLAAPDLEPIEGVGTVDLSQAPFQIQTDEEIQVALLIPKIPPALAGVLPFTISIPTAGAFELQTWVNNPIFASSAAAETALSSHIRSTSSVRATAASSALELESIFRACHLPALKVLIESLILMQSCPLTAGGHYRGVGVTI